MGLVATMIIGIVAGQLHAKAASSTWDSGLEFVSFHYSEPSARMSEDGSMIGVVGAYARDFEDVTIRSEASFDWGIIGYNGFLMNFKTGETISAMTLDTPNCVLNLRLSGGPWLKIDSSSLRITPLLGVGFRYLANDLPGVGGYLRQQIYWYAPVGMEVAGALSAGWSCVVRAEYDVFVDGENYSGGDSFTQKDGYGYQVSAGVSCLLPGKGARSVLVAPYMRYWNISASSVTEAGWLEPANNCSEYGIKASVAF